MAHSSCLHKCTRLVCNGHRPTECRDTRVCITFFSYTLFRVKTDLNYVEKQRSVMPFLSQAAPNTDMAKTMSGHELIRLSLSRVSACPCASALPHEGEVGGSRTDGRTDRILAQWAHTQLSSQHCQVLFTFEGLQRRL